MKFLDEADAKLAHRRAVQGRRKAKGPYCAISGMTVQEIQAINAFCRQTIRYVPTTVPVLDSSDEPALVLIFQSERDLIVFKMGFQGG